MKDDDAWFAPKRFGYGAGVPIAWQGWALLGGYLAVMTGGAWLLAAERPGGFGVLTLVATVVTGALAAAHTRGGWCWRWGSEE